MSWVLIIFFSVFSILELLLFIAFTKRKDKIAAKATLSSFVFLWTIFIVARVLHWNMPDVAFTLMVISFLIQSFCGYFLKLFYNSRKFDRFAHGVGAFSFAIFFYFFFSNIFEYGGSKLFRSFYILLLGVTSGATFEIIEFVSDLKQNRKMQRGLRDTNFDIVSDVVGSFAASILAYFVLI